MAQVLAIGRHLTLINCTPMDRVIHKKKFRLRNLLLAAAILAAGLVGVYFLMNASAHAELRVQKERLTLGTVHYENFREYIAVTGSVMPEKTVILDAGEGGKVEEIYAESGQMVKKGDLILKLSNNTLQMNFINRESDILEQINTLRNTKILVEEKSLTLKEQLLETEYALSKSSLSYQRNTQLFQKGVIPQAEYEPIREEYDYLVKKKKILTEKLRQDSVLSKYQLSSIDPSLNLMQKNLEFIEKSLDNLVIKAPIDGQVSSLNVEYGQSVNAGQPLAQIDVWDGFKVRVGVDEYYLSRIMIGQRGIYTFNGIDYELEITKVFPEVSGGKFRIDMIFTGTVPDGIRRGQTLQIKLALGDESKALQVPRGSFYNESGGSWIYVINKEGTAAYKKQIRLGRQNPGYYEVLEGLEEGDQVIVSDYSSFRGIDKLILR